MWWKRKNKPTVAELKSLYESEVYQNLLLEFAKRSNREIDNSEQDESELLQELTWLQENYAILDTPFEEILSEFKNSQDQFLDYLIELKKYKKIPIVSKIHKIYLLRCFCLFYILKTGAREQQTKNKFWFFRRTTRK
jgi:hypothetical protein